MLCSGVELVRGVVVERRGVAGTMQLGYRGREREREKERERERGREKEKERERERERERIHYLNYKLCDNHTLLCMHSTALSSSLISSLLMVTSDLACSSCLWYSFNLLSLASCNNRGCNNLYRLGKNKCLHNKKVSKLWWNTFNFALSDFFSWRSYLGFLSVLQLLLQGSDALFSLLDHLFILCGVSLHRWAKLIHLHDKRGLPHLFLVNLSTNVHR